MARKISLTLSLGVYFAHDHQEAEAALVQQLGRLSTYVWTTYYETPGFASEAISRGKHAAEGRALEAKKQDQNVRRAT